MELLFLLCITTSFMVTHGILTYYGHKLFDETIDHYRRLNESTFNDYLRYKKLSEDQHKLIVKLHNIEKEHAKQNN